MVSLIGKNLSNRFEEAYGDAGNLRSRYPLAAVGFFWFNARPSSPKSRTRSRRQST